MSYHDNLDSLVGPEKELLEDESSRNDYLPTTTTSNFFSVSLPFSSTSLSEENQLTTEPLADLPATLIADPTMKDPDHIDYWPSALWIDDDLEWSSDYIVHNNIPNGGGASGSQDMLFDFPKLPKELQTYFLRFVLRAPGGRIINPWHQNEQDIHEEPEPSRKYTWGNYFRPNILAASTELNYEGTNILYEHNTFVFTRRVFNDSENRTAKIAEFFSFHHQLRLTFGTAPSVPRSKLIKNVCLQDSDLDSDVLAAKGYAKPLPEEPTYRGMAWQFKLLRQMEWQGFDLSKLTITLDQDVPGLLSHLRYETKMRQFSGGIRDTFTTVTPEEDEQRRLSWKDLRQDSDAEEPFPYTYEDKVFGLDGLHTQKLYIRGMSANAHGIRAFLPNERPRITNVFAHELKSWLESTDIFPYEIAFTGAFQSRRLRELDGSFIDDDSWYPVNVPLPKGDDEELLEPHEVPLPFDMNEGLGFYAFI